MHWPGIMLINWCLRIINGSEHRICLQLDQRGDGDAIQDALLEVTGRRSVPQVFIGGTSLLNRQHCGNFLLEYLLVLSSTCMQEHSLAAVTRPLRQQAVVPSARFWLPRVWLREILL